MKVDTITTKNDECYTPVYAITPILKYIDSSKRIWCPFDTKDSHYVKELNKHGNKVTYTHIDTGDDFFSTAIQCDIIVSNPPYSIKTEILSELFSRKIPFAMLIGVVGLFESEKRFSLFKNNKFEVMYLNRRVAFFSSFDEEKPRLNPPFSSIYICHNMLPQQIIFERINKKNI